MEIETVDAFTLNRQEVKALRDISRSRSNLVRAKQSLALGVSSGMRASAQPHPIYIDRGSGPRFIDVDGNEFVDHCLAWGPLMLGHAHPAINEAVSRQLERGYTFGAQCELEIRVAERVRELVPCAGRVLFSNTGTEAVQSALRIARAATGRQKILKFEGHYHGWFDNVLVSYTPSLADAGPDARPNLVPSSAGQSSAAYVDTVVLPWNDGEMVENYFAEYGDEIAAIITEPMMCNNGCILPAPGYLETLRRLADRYGTVLIFDEVITGFRVHLGGAQSLFGVIPDLAIFGKAMGGGFPFSVVAGKESLIREVDSGRVVHAGTFNGNPIVLSAALATIEVLAVDEGATIKKACRYGDEAISMLSDLAEERGLPLTVAGHGMVFRPVIGAQTEVRNYRDFAVSDRKACDALVVELFNRGVYCVPDGRWYVSIMHAEAELQHLKSVLPDAVRAFADVYWAQKSVGAV